MRFLKFSRHCCYFWTLVSLWYTIIRNTRVRYITKNSAEINKRSSEACFDKRLRYNFDKFCCRTFLWISHLKMIWNKTVGKETLPSLFLPTTIKSKLDTNSMANWIQYSSLGPQDSLISLSRKSSLLLDSSNSIKSFFPNSISNYPVIRVFPMHRSPANLG